MTPVWGGDTAKQYEKKNSIAPDHVAKQGHKKGIVKAIQDILPLVCLKSTFVIIERLVCHPAINSWKIDLSVVKLRTNGLQEFYPV